MKKAIQYIWVSIILITLVYDIYLHILISYFDYTPYMLKSELIRSTISYSIVTLPLGLIVGILFSLFNFTIHNFLILKLLNIILLILNYILLFIVIPIIYNYKK